MKKIRVVFSVGCIVLMAWIFSGRQQQATSSLQEVKNRNITQPAEPLHQHIEYPRKKSEGRSLFVPNVRNRNTIVGSDDDEAPIEYLEPPNDMVYPPTTEGIRDVSVLFRPNIVDCYNQALNANPNMGGRLIASFRIEKPEEGDFDQDLARIADVEILDSDVDHEHLENCIMDNVDNFWFDPPYEEYVDVRLPFVFVSN